MTQVQPGQVGHRFPQVLPDGRHFLYYSAGAPETAGIYVARLDGSDARRLVPTDSAGVFASSGHLLFIKQGTLHALRFDPARLAVVGSPFSVAENVAVDSGFGRPATLRRDDRPDPLSSSRAAAAGSNSSGSIAVGRNSRGWESRTAFPWLTHRCHRTAAASR